MSERNSASGPRTENTDESYVPSNQTEERIRNTLLTDLVDLIRGANAAAPIATPAIPAITAPRNVSSLARTAGAKDFSGSSRTAATEAEFWFERLIRVSEELSFSTEEKLRCAIALLADESYQWWTSTIQRVAKEDVTWEFFETKFKAKYIGEAYYAQRRTEFETLRQGSMSVQEYEHEFTRLSAYAPEMVSSETLLCQRFLRGLEPSMMLAVSGFNDRNFSDLRDRVNQIETMRKFAESNDRGQSDMPPRSAARSPVRSHHTTSIHHTRHAPSFKKGGSSSHQHGISRSRPQRSVHASVASTGGSGQRPTYPLCPTCSRHHSGECWRATGACFACGSKDHSIRDCPRKQQQFAAPAPPSAPIQTGDRNASGSRVQRAPSGASARSVAKVPARTYAIRAQEEHDDRDIADGIIY